MQRLYSVGNQLPFKHLPSIRSLVVASLVFYKKYLWDLLPLLFVWTLPLVLGFFSDHPIYQIFLFVLSIIAGFWFSAALIYLVHTYADTSQQKENLLILLKKSIHFIIPFIWLSILDFAIFFGITIVLFIPAVLISLVLASLEISNFWQLFLLSISAIPIIFLTILFIFSRYALIIENQTGLNALLRSRQLVKGCWWSIFLRALFLFLLVLPLTALYFLFFYLFPPTLGLFEQPHFKILSIVMSFLFILIFSFRTIFQYLIFRFLISKKPLDTFNPQERRGFYKGFAIFGASVIIYVFLIIAALIIFGFLMIAMDRMF